MEDNKVFANIGFVHNCAMHHIGALCTGIGGIL